MRYVEIFHVDTCTPDFLQNHHNRENECLIGIPVFYEDTYDDVIRELQDNLIGEFDNEFPLAITALTENVSDMNKPFDTMLPSVSETDCPPQAWFLIKWEN